MQSDCCFADKVVVNGITFAKELWLPNFKDENTKIHRIGDIVVTKPNDINSIFLMCKTYNKINSHDHTAGYSVDLDSLQERLNIIKVNEYLAHHQYPVLVYNVGNLHVFRCKRF